jgi:hypothetical protein
MLTPATLLTVGLALANARRLALAALILDLTLQQMATCPN